MKTETALQNTDVFHSDAAITNFDQDLFERKEFTSRLNEKILQFKAKNSLVIALYGPWGSGKTSVLNLISQTLSQEKKVKVLNFDPWYFNSQEQLIQAFLNTILGEAIKIAGEDQSSLKEKLELYRIAIASAFTVTPKIEAFGFSVDTGALKPLQDLKEPSAVKESLRINISGKDIKFVILIDNLDRLEPTELLLMFKLVKLCADFPNFVYVLAFDHKQAEKILKKQDVDPEFLAKIVQVDIELPNIEQGKIDAFIFQNLLEIATKHDIYISSEQWKRLKDTYQLAISGFLIDDLRKAKRFINSVSFSFSLLKGGLDFSDFILLEVLRIFNPQIYGLIPYYKKTLTGLRYDEITMKPFNVFRKKMANSTDVVLKPIFETIVGAIFPSFRQFCASAGKEWELPSDPRYVIEQRICAEEMFDKYFQFKTPQEPLSRLVINDMVKSINEGKVDVEQLAEFFLNHAQENRLALALARFQLMLYFKNDHARQLVIDSLILISPHLHWQIEFNFVNPGQAAASLLKTCLEGFSTGEKALIDFITKADLIYILSASNTIIFERKEDVWGISEQPIEHAVEALRSRFRQEFLMGDKNIFIEYSENSINLLKLWMKVIDNSDKADFQEYLYRQNKKHERVLPMLLQVFIPSPSFLNWGNNKASTFEKIEEWFDINKMAQDYMHLLKAQDMLNKLTAEDIEILSVIGIEINQQNAKDHPNKKN